MNAMHFNKMKRFLTLSAILMLSACANVEQKEADGAMYLDYAASWSLNEESLAEFARVSRLLGNSSGINDHAEYLKELERGAASVIAAKISADADQIHFVPGATAANNIAILGVAYKNPKCHLITSQIEHKSVLNVFKHLESLGYKVTYLAVDKHGRIDLDQLERSITPNTKLISIQTFNSEIGVLQDISRIGEIAHEHGVLFHADAAQSFCKYDINTENVDFLTLSGHKIGAPKGIGALYVKDISQIQPIMFGSGDILWPGTKSTALICAFAKAVEKYNFNKDQITKNYYALVNEISKISDVYINSSTPSHVVSVSIGGVLLKDILQQMHKYSFSAGCSCLGKDKSNVIEAIDPEGELPSTIIRISFTDQITEQELIKFATNLKNVVETLRKEKKIQKNCESTPDSNPLAGVLKEIEGSIAED